MWSATYRACGHISVLFPAAVQFCSGMCMRMCGSWSVFEGCRQPSAGDLPWDGEDVRSRRGVMCQSWLRVCRVTPSSSLVAEKQIVTVYNEFLCLRRSPEVGGWYWRWHKAPSLSLLGSVSAYSQTLWLKLAKKLMWGSLNSSHPIDLNISYLMVLQVENIAVWNNTLPDFD